MIRLLARVWRWLHLAECLTCFGDGVWFEGDYQHPCPYCDGHGYVEAGSQTEPYQRGRW